MITDIGSDYYDSAEGVLITTRRACQELDAHGIYREADIDEALDTAFVRAEGDDMLYDAQRLLAWLGY